MFRSYTCNYVYPSLEPTRIFHVVTVEEIAKEAKVFKVKELLEEMVKMLNDVNESNTASRDLEAWTKPLNKMTKGKEEVDPKVGKVDENEGVSEKKQ